MEKSYSSPSYFLVKESEKVPSNKDDDDEKNYFIGLLLAGYLWLI